MIPVLGTQAWPTVSPRDRKSPRLSRPQFPHQHTEMAALALRASQTSEGAVRLEGRGTVASRLRRHELLGGRTSAALRQVAEGGLQRGGRALGPAPSAQPGLAPVTGQLVFFLRPSFVPL